MDLVLHWLLSLSLAVASFFLIPLLYDGHRRRRGLPPGPTPLPVIGNILELGDQPHRALARLSRTYGPLISLQLGTVTTVVASDPGMAREILHKHDAVFSARYITDAYRAYVGASMAWLPPGQQWRGLRKISVTELLSTRRLDAQQSLRRQKVQEMLAYVQELSAKGEPVDIGRVVFATSLNLISRTSFSVDMVELGSSSSQEFKCLLTGMVEIAAAPNISDFFPVLAPADLQGLRRRGDKLFAEIFAVFDKQIELRLKDRAAGLPAKDDILDVLLDLKQAEQDIGVRVDQSTMRSFFTDLFGAGSDTSSTTVEWAMTELFRNPESMAKAQQELTAAIPQGRAMEESDICSLPYLQAVVKETLRLHPPVPLLLPRRATRAMLVGGYIIPEGARIFINVWAIGRSEAVWPEPEKFMPERFLDSSVDYKGQNFELSPFGAGRRMCPGIPLASRMVHLMLGSLLQRFGWKLPGELAKEAVDTTEAFGLSLAKAVPLRALAVPQFTPQ